ncbi:unnamed protein product [Enterobius vermicularis]|uniref:Transmembrane protein n=1 Tax=Enterobius vermicularis TaxID=51028 RepID=A0A0N4VCK1_ENTVE|nr:unnamed protein product [Enterobius vermicularis]
MFVPTNGNFRRVWIQNESADNSECQGYDSYNAVHEFWHHVWIVNNSDFKPVENTNYMIIVLTAVIASTLPVTVAAVGGYRGRYEWCRHALRLFQRLGLDFRQYIQNREVGIDAYKVV